MGGATPFLLKYQEAASLILVHSSREEVLKEEKTHPFAWVINMNS
jgi:hypothetical protein